MIIEQNTNYAYKLKYMDNPTFDKVRDLSAKFYRELPHALQDELHDALNRGIDILDSEPQMTAYMFSFGKMHQAKLEYAFSKLPEEFLKQPEINIIDYGCGQALGTMCYADYLRNNGYAQNVKTITLIEPSEICLKRAVLHASMFFPNAKIKTVNKTFDELDENNIHCDEDISTLHILSNVLDILDIDLADLTELIKKQITGYNQFVCVGPYFNFPVKDERMDDFRSLLDGEESYYEFFYKYEFDFEKNWTAQIQCFSIRELIEDSLSTKATDLDVVNGNEDEFGVIYSMDGKKLLRCNNPRLEHYSIKNGTEAICDYAFSNVAYLRHIDIPNSIIKIGNGAFRNCFSLTNIVIPKHVKTIGYMAFDSCNSLNEIYLPNSVTRIGYGAFSNCYRLKDVVLPKYIRSIGQETPGYVTPGVFEHCPSIESIIIPKYVKHIASWTFNDCESLYEITIPNSIKEIRPDTFSGCKSLHQIIIPDSVERIGDAAFMDCRSMKQLTIPDSVNSIGDTAFGGCFSLQQLTIPNSLNSIGSVVFHNCRSLKKLTIPETVNNMGFNPFIGCDKLRLESSSSRYILQSGFLVDKQASKIISYLGKERSVVVPESVEHIGSSAFSQCYFLQKVIIPRTVTHIDDSAFHACISLKLVVIPDSVISIGNSVFVGCRSLQRIIIPHSSLECFKTMIDNNLWNILVEA